MFDCKRLACCEVAIPICAAPGCTAALLHRGCSSDGALDSGCRCYIYYAGCACCAMPRCVPERTICLCLPRMCLVVSSSHASLRVASHWERARPASRMERRGGGGANGALSFDRHLFGFYFVLFCSKLTLHFVGNVSNLKKKKLQWFQ